MIKRRIYEIIPGALVWITLLLPFFFSLTKPAFVVYFVICFDLYWLYKALLMGGHLISGYNHYKRELDIDWLKRLESLSNLDFFIEQLKEEIKKAKNFQKKRLQEELDDILLIKNKERILQKWEDIYQVVIFPTYKEELEILRASFLALKNAAWPKERLIAVLATEERDKERARKNAKAIKKEFGSVFFKLLITRHPDNLKNELKAKGANATWAAKKLKIFLDEEKILYKNVIVSTFDADTQCHPLYFAALCYKYITTPCRLHRSYQPIPLYSNNIWEAPSIARLIAFSSSFWQLIEATRPYRMVNFSAQAMSMQTLLDIDFWDKTIISEDSRQYYRAYFAYDGDHKVVPIFIPAYMDAVLGENFWDTLKEQYLQKRRWAWGIEHFPYLLEEFPKHKKIPLSSKLLVFWRLFEGHYSWATASLLLALVGILPFILNPYFRTTILAYNLPMLARNLLGLTWIGIIVSTLISIKLLPEKPKLYPKWKDLSMYFQWLLVPVSAIFFGSIPSVDAQTRLMLGKKMKFWVTKKVFVR